MQDLIEMFCNKNVVTNYYDFCVFVTMLDTDISLTKIDKSGDVYDLYNFIGGNISALSTSNSALNDFLTKLSEESGDNHYFRIKLEHALSDMKYLFTEMINLSDAKVDDLIKVSESDGIDLSKMISILEDYKYELSYEDLKRCGRICDSVLINNMLAENGIDNVTYDDLMKYIKG